MPYELVNTDANDQIVITLHEDASNGLNVRSIDLFVSAMKVRFSSHRNNGISQVFQQDISDILSRICDKAKLSKQIINVPDFCLRIRGLLIEGYTLLVHTLESGLRQFVIRLKRTVGNALALFSTSEDQGSGLSLFKSQMSAAGDTSIDPERLFDEMLEHLYLPLVNLNTYLKQVLEGQLPNETRSLAASVVDLKTKAEVLQFAFDRVLSEAMIAKFPVQPDPAPQMPERTLPV